MRPDVVGDPLDQRVDLRTEEGSVHRELGGVGGARKEAAGRDRAIPPEPRCRARLGVVVVVPREPEEGDHRALPPLLEEVGEGLGGERLVDGVEGPGKEPGLLPRRDHDYLGVAELGEERLGARCGDDRVEQRRVEAARAGGRPLRMLLERGGDDAEGHAARSAMRMARGDPAVIGAPV